MDGLILLYLLSIPGCSVHTGVLLIEISQMWLLECYKRRWLHECDLKLFLNILDHEVELFKEYSMPGILWTSLRKQQPCIHASKQTKGAFYSEGTNTKNARKSGMSPNDSVFKAVLKIIWRQSIRVPWRERAKFCLATDL